MSFDPSRLAGLLGIGALLLLATSTLWLAWRLGQRRERAQRRDQSARWRDAVESFFARELDGPALGRAARDVPIDLFWSILSQLAPRRIERRRLGEALARWRPVRLERFAIRDDDLTRAQLAAHRLGLACSRGARLALRLAVRRAQESVASAAALSLARAGDAWALRYVLARPEVTARRTPRFRFALLRAFGPRACPMLLTALERATLDPAMVRAIIEVLSARRHREAAGEIVRRIRHPEPELRVAAVRAVGELALMEHVLSLKAALDDPHWAVRAQAARSLGRMRAHRCEEALAAKLADTSWWVRRHAAYALADLGRPGLEKLAEVVERTDDRFAREIAQEALDGGFLQDSA